MRNVVLAISVALASCGPNLPGVGDSDPISADSTSIDADDGEHDSPQDLDLILAETYDNADPVAVGADLVERDGTRETSDDTSDESTPDETAHDIDLPDGSAECPAGTVPGVCGLKGQCVECVRDSDCESYVGIPYCDGRARCSFIEPLCTSDKDCLAVGEELRCEPWTGACRKACVADDTCRMGEYCHEERLCIERWCMNGQDCPDGTIPVPGTLLCAPPV